MSRLVRRFSWKQLGLVVAVALLSLVAPEAWRRWQSQPELASGGPPRATSPV